MSAVMHSESAPATMNCKCCSTPFEPRRPWQTFCSAQCRTNYHQAHGHEGTIKAVRRLKRGWSVVVHMPDDAGFELGATIQVVRR